MAGIGKYKKGAKFALRSSNKPSGFKMMGSSSPLRDGKYTGMSKAELRASVLANNKNKDASDKDRLAMNTEIRRWRLQNRELPTGPKSGVKTEIRKKVVVEPVEKETGFVATKGNVTIGSGSKFDATLTPEQLAKQELSRSKVSRADR